MSGRHGDLPAGAGPIPVRGLAAITLLLTSLAACSLVSGGGQVNAGRVGGVPTASTVPTSAAAPAAAALRTTTAASTTTGAREPSRRSRPAARKATRTPRSTSTTTTKAKPKAKPRTTTTRPRTSTRAPAPPSGGGSMSSREREVLRLTNAERSQHGCRALTADSRLVRAAGGHASDMVRRQYFSHTSPDGEGPGERLAEVGFSGRGWGENIAAGQPTARSVVDGWMNSPGHRANILNCDFNRLGVGYVNGAVQSGYSPHVWVQNFGTV